MQGRERDLEKELAQLGSRVDYPPTPELARTVRERIEARGTRPVHRGTTGTRIAPARWVAAAAILLLVLPALSPAVRSSVTDVLASGSSGGGGAAGGARGTSVAEQTTAVRADPGAASAGSAPAPAPGASLGLGERLSAPGARARVGALLVPRTQQGPQVVPEIRAGGPSFEDGVVLVFGARPGLPPLGGSGVGLLLAEVRKEPGSAYPGLGGDARARAEEVRVGEHRGYWIPDGRALRSQPGMAEHLPGGALVWEQGDVALLMRADVSRDEAVEIAGSVR